LELGVILVFIGKLVIWKLFLLFEWLMYNASYEEIIGGWRWNGIWICEVLRIMNRIIDKSNGGVCTIIQSYK
jgi:hypothetical protein